MAATDKDFELDGHTLPTQELLAEAARLVDLARTHAMVMRTEGFETKDYTALDQMKDQVQKESARVETPPPKVVSLNKEQEKVLARAYAWRAVLVRKVDRIYADDRYSRLRFHRGLHLFKTPDRVFEELMLLIQNAKQDLKRLAPVKVDEDMLGAGEDLCYLLLNLQPPDRKAWAEYETAVAMHRYGPPPKKPADPVKLPPVTDSAKGLSILKGRLYLQMRHMSFAGQAAFCFPKDPKEAQKFEALRRDFMLRVKPTEDDEELITLGRFNPDAAVAAAPVAAPAAKPAAGPADKAALPPPLMPGAPIGPAPVKPAETSSADKGVLPMDRVTSKPGGPNPPAAPDALKKPPPRAVGLVRPSAITGNKT